jgi:glycosyltransferase involved in cell wall biosynthesis
MRLRSEGHAVNRIGIDARAAVEVPAGRGRFVRELLSTLAARDDDHRYLLYARQPWGELDGRFRWVVVDTPDPLWNVQVGLIAHRESDVFFSVNSYLTAWFTRVPTALNVFDLIAWEAPESAQRRAARIERATIRIALRRAGHVFVNSQSTLNDLRRRFPAAAEKGSVVPLAAFDREPAGIEKFGLDRPFVLFTGTVEPRKNLLRLIEALPEGALLVVAGPRGWEDDPILRRAGDQVRFLGRVSDRELAGLYRLCTVFCYPSLYEGFGLPVLEALQAGAPVVTSNVSSLPEVAGDAARYVDPRSVDQIRAALIELLGSEEAREALRARAQAQAAQFSWDRTAEQILAQLAAISRS